MRTNRASQCLADPECLSRLRAHVSLFAKVGTAEDFWYRSQLEQFLRGRGHQFFGEELVDLLNAPEVNSGFGIRATSARVPADPEPRWSEVATLDGIAFEVVVKQVYERLGFGVTLTPSGPDGGADLILEKSAVKTVVQAKRYSESVGVAAVQQVVAAIKLYEAHRACVVTTSTFTPQAVQLAEVNDVLLIEGRALLALWDAAGLPR